MTLPSRKCFLLVLLALIGTACSLERITDGYWASSIADGISGGFTLLFSGASNLLLHPFATLEGIYLALEHWEITRGDLLAEWKFYRRAFSADLGSFAGTSLVVTICVISSALVANFLETIPDWVSRWRNGRRNTRRLISQAVFAGRAGIRRRVYTILRAKNMQVEKRLATRGTGMSAVFRRVRWVALDILRGLRRVITEPLPYLVYLLFRLGEQVLAFTKTTLRVTWRQLAYSLLPVVLVFQTWIGWSVDFSIASADARRQLAPAVELYLESVASLPVDELKKRTEAMQAIYVAYREALLVSVHDLDRVLKAQLNALNLLVRTQILAAPALDLRVKVILNRDSRRILFLGELLFGQSVGDEHGPTDPSRNWLESYVDEQGLLSMAEDQVRGSQANNYLAARIGDLDRRLAFEHCIARYKVTELLKRPLSREHEFCGTLEAPNSVDEMMRRLFFPGEE